VSGSSLLLAPGEALVVVGALATKPADRSLERHQINPVQVFTSDGVEPVRSLDCGEFGMSSLVIRPEAGVVYGSSGNDFFRLDLDDGKTTDLAIEGVADSHEVTEIDGTLWIANTGRDEAVAFDLATERVVRRVPVGPARGSETVDKFHANQVVRALDGKLYVLVHHVDGKQIVKYVAQRLVKMQGNGGVIELETGRRVALSLSGPHSIEAVGPDEQWICDSRAGLLRAYDRDWRERAEIACAGWARGVSVSPSSGRVYVGISAIRKRYLQVIPSSQHSQNLVQVFDGTARTLIGETRVPHVETINNLYIVTRETADRLLGT
jgi:sugar lactone lactonase YvrE